MGILIRLIASSAVAHSELERCVKAFDVRVEMWHRSVLKRIEACLKYDLTYGYEPWMISSILQHILHKRGWHRRHLT